MAKVFCPLVILVIFLGAVTLGAGGYIAYAGGKIRHREFRNEPAPPKQNGTPALRECETLRRVKSFLSRKFEEKDLAILSTFAHGISSTSLRNDTKIDSTLQRLTDAN